jgi:hypothetical protein
MVDPWERAYVYGRTWWYSKAAHVVALDSWGNEKALCGADIVSRNRTHKPYPVCKNCLRTKRAKELGL